MRRREHERKDETMTATKPTADLIGKSVEFIHPVQGSRMIGMVTNIFANGKIRIAPRFARNGDTLRNLGGKRPEVNVRFDRCELVNGTGWMNI
jgi:hypothetical protein